MNGRDLALGLVAGLALAGAVRSRGSRAMLRPETLPSDVRVQVHIDRSGLHAFVEIGALRGEDVVGIFRMERGFRPGHPSLFEVSETEARLDGLGPLLYDLGLEVAHRLHATGVVPDQSEISTEAARVWKHYHEQRPDVTSTPLPRGFLDEEEEEERRFATDPRQGHAYTSGPYRESLARVYSKTSTSVMDGLVRRGMLEMESAHGSAARTVHRTNPALWEAVKAQVTASDTGGRPGQWSARKAQRAVQIYTERGGGYLGPKDPDNALSRWTKQDWRTRSGGESLKTGERYLPAAAFDLLTPAEVGATTRAKRAGLARGQQFTPQPPNIARKTKKAREGAANVIAPRTTAIFGTSPRSSRIAPRGTIASPARFDLVRAWPCLRPGSSPTTSNARQASSTEAGSWAAWPS